MPDAQGKLSSEDKEKIQKWLKEKWKASNLCPISQDNKWIINDYVTTPMNFGGGGMIVGGQVTPQIMMICASCGYTLYFNAMVMGILKPDVKPDGK